MEEKILPRKDMAMFAVAMLSYVPPFLRRVLYPFEDLHCTVLVLLCIADCVDVRRYLLERNIYLLVVVLMMTEDPDEMDCDRKDSRGCV